MLEFEGDARVGEVHEAVLEGRATTRAASPGTTPTTTAPSSPATSRHAQRRLDLHRGAERRRQVQDREGRAAAHRHPARAAARRAERARSATTPLPPHGDEVLEEPKRRERVPAVGPQARRTTRSGSTCRRASAVGPTKDWEKHPMWSSDPVMEPFKTAADSSAAADGLRRPAEPARPPRPGTSSSSP